MGEQKHNKGDDNLIGVQLHERQVDQVAFNADVMPDTGEVKNVKPGAFLQAQDQEGWFIRKVCGSPYSWELLKDAAAGTCNKYPYTIVLRESIVAGNDTRAGIETLPGQREQQVQTSDPWFCRRTVDRSCMCLSCHVVTAFELHGDAWREHLPTYPAATPDT